MPVSLNPPSEIRQWMWGFHLRSLPNVWSTIIKPGVKFRDLLTLKNIRETTLVTEWNKQSSKLRSFKKKSLRLSSMVNTQCLCWVWTSLKDIFVVRSMEYLFPQVGQNRLWQRKGTNLSFPQWGQPYMAPPKDGSPQLIIFSIFCISAALGCKVYFISS